MMQWPVATYLSAQSCLMQGIPMYLVAPRALASLRL
jgi:hypothetical protein